MLRCIEHLCKLVNEPIVTWCSIAEEFEKNRIQWDIVELNEIRRGENLFTFLTMQDKQIRPKVAQDLLYT